MAKVKVEDEVEVEVEIKVEIKFQVITLMEEHAEPISRNHH